MIDIPAIKDNAKVSNNEREGQRAHESTGDGARFGIRGGHFEDEPEGSERKKDPADDCSGLGRSV